MIRIVTAAALAATMLSGCVRDARIAMPSGLAAETDRIEMAGLGFSRSGDFTLGASRGDFHRAAASHSDGLHVWNRGGGRFAVSGPEVNGSLAGNCRYAEDLVELGGFELTDARFEYHCRFERAGEPVEGRLVLAQIARSPGRLLSAETRGGFLDYDGRTLGITAIHDMEGGRIPSGTPLGYAFHLDGRQIGAIDLNGGSKTIYAPRSGPDREAVLAAAMALAILWHDGA